MTATPGGAAGSLTTRARGLRHLFYWPFNADVSTVRADDAGKQPTTPGAVGDFGAEWSQALTWSAIQMTSTPRCCRSPVR